MQTAEGGAATVSRFPKAKGPITRRIFVVGGSVAQLFGEAALKRSLESALPGYEFEVIGCGRSAYDSARDLLTVEEVLDYDPDLIVVLSGVNEVDHPLIRSLWLRALRGLARGILAGRPLRAWRIFGPDLRGVPGAGEVVAEFEGNVSRMIRAARGRGVPIALCPLPWNVRGMPPKGELPLGRRAFFDAWIAFERGEHSAAAEGFRRFLSAGPPPWEAAFGRFFLARCLDRLGLHPAAKAEYEAAALDQIPPMPAVNRALRRLAADEGAVLADFERTFQEAGADGIPGYDLFEDDVHWVRGCDAMAAATLTRALAEAAGRSAVLAPREDWEPVPGLRPPAGMAKTWDAFTYRVWDALRFGSLNRFSERVIGLLGEVHRRNPYLLRDGGGLKPWLRARLEGNVWRSDGAAGLEAWWPEMEGHAGEALLREGRAGDALRLFSSALKENGGLDYVRVRRAVALAALGKTAEALRSLKDLERLGSHYPEIAYYAEVFARGPAAPRRTPPPARREAARPRAAPPPAPAPDRTALQPLRRIIALLRRGDVREGLAAYRSEVRRDPAALRAAEGYCAARAEACAPLTQARARLSRLKEEGMGLFTGGDAAGAARLFDEVLSLDPLDPDALMSRAALSAARGDWQGAKDLLDRIVSEEPDSKDTLAGALTARAEALAALGRPEEAARDLDLALRKAPRDWAGRTATEADLARLRRNP
ncbi:MAG: hypothetical protein A2X36_02940 [Elusimicrobia bacterium GWA2_69_24]|nr:MAG: hypothetical protein A2X36_02940 [Elusimicrobia bacterium GWA2_69_24]HBL17711.1 hypothetical protein [Elusimicrobiota bacterium]